MVSVVLLCCFSSYSLAYDQQYQVGGTGPQGGTVTSVSVASVLDSTSTQQVGDNLETVTVTKFTETVVENVTSTQQVTQTTINTTETTTGDIITTTNLNNSKVTCADSGSGFYNDPQGCDRHTRIWNDLHIGTDGQYTFTSDLDHWMNQESMNYGFSAEAEAQAKDAQPNTPSTFTITVKLFDPDTNESTLETNSWTLTNSYQTFSTTLDVDTNTYGPDSQIIAQFMANDPGGYNYSTDVQNFALDLTYDVLETVVETINQTITNSVQSAIDTLESQTSLVYNPLIQPGTDTTMTQTTQEAFEVEIVDDSGGGVQLEFTVEIDETANVANVEMASTNLETGVVTIENVAEISLDFSADSGGTTEVVNVAEVEATVESAVAEATTETQVAEATTETTEATTEAEAETETTETASTETETETTETASSDTKTADSKSKSKSKEKTKTAKKETKREKIEKEVAKAKQRIAEKILMAMADTYSAINEATKIALMASLTDTESFKAYQKKNNEDLANWYSDLQVYRDMPPLIDPAAQLYELASDKIMNEMIEEQYK